MGGDNTRFTFNQKNHYNSVLMQQGRVQLDADWNEQMDIQAYIDRTTTGDTVGLCGAPMHDAGFGLKCKNSDIAAAGCPSADLVITCGAYYVDGILCENERDDMNLARQDDLPQDSLMVKLKDGTEKKLSDAQDGTYLAYLDAWEREITAIEDEKIREKSLGGPDTATRKKTIWQVKLLQVDDAQWCENISSNALWKNLLQGSTGKLKAKTTGGSSGKDPCIIPTEANYRRLENQLYRVEVHKGGSRAYATFKWSRDNGSVVTAIEKISGNKVTVQSMGRDAQSFASSQWVEVLDDAKELKGEPGELVQIESVDIAAREITMKTPPAALAATADGVDITLHPKLRRWDHDVDQEATKDGIKMKNAAQSLEGGITAQFTDANSTYRTGDYWLIPARTAIGDYKGDIEWFPDDFQLPHGIKHHYCPLALLTFAANKWTLKSDCRKLFPPLTELISFFYVSGDGQEAMPGQTLPKPFQVSVTNGPFPVVRAKIKFQRTLGTGTLKPGASTVDASGADYITVLTDSNGIAECFLQLDILNQTQQVEATLLTDAGTNLYHPIRFNANLSKASEVAYDPQPCTSLMWNNKIPTLQELLKTNPVGWPTPQPNTAGNITVKQALDTLLCKLDARKIPYDPTVKKDRWEDIKETPLGEPPSPNNVQAALDDLVENLESSDITYRSSNCGDADNPTVRSLLGIQANSDIKLSDLLNRILCELNATALPIKKPDNLCKELNNQKVKTVQDALAVLCDIANQQQEGVQVSTGLVIFKDMQPGEMRLTDKPIKHELKRTYPAILMAIQSNFIKDVHYSMGDLYIYPAYPAITAEYHFKTDSFDIRLKDNRAKGSKPLTYNIRWWAISNSNFIDKLVEVPAPQTSVPDIGFIAHMLTVRQGMTLQDLSSAVDIAPDVLKTHLDKFVQAGFIEIENGKYFIK